LTLTATADRELDTTTLQNNVNQMLDLCPPPLISLAIALMLCIRLLRDPVRFTSSLRKLQRCVEEVVSLFMGVPAAQKEMILSHQRLGALLAASS